MTWRLTARGDLPRLLEALDRAPRAAIDTEFHAERRYEPQLYLVQIHVDGGGTWLVDALDRDMLGAIAPALRRVPWVVHGGGQDLRLLERALGGVPDEVLDTQIAAALTDVIWPVGYGPLVKRCLGHELEKGATLSDWSRRPLTDAQLAYAADDVALLFDLWDRLDADLARLGRADVARQACAEAREAAITRGEPPWRDMLGSTLLSPQQATVMYELAIWRDEVARGDDQPPRVVLNDALLLDLSRRQPRDLHTLGADRRLTRPFLKKHGDALIDRIGRAASRPEWAWPRLVRRDTPQARQVTFLEVYADALGHAGSFSGRFVLPRTRLEDVLIAAPPTRSALAEQLGAWRDPVVGDGLWAALSGRGSLRLGGGDVAIG